MAEEKKQLCGIDWQQTFAFTNVFRSFRLAIHPSKLVLAFLGLAICFVAGLVLDRIWYAGPAIIWEDGQPAEVQVFAKGGQDFSAWYEAAHDSRQGKLKRMRDRELGADVEEISIESAALADRIIDVRKEELKIYIEENNLEKRIAGVKERYEGQPEKIRERVKALKQEVPQQLRAKRKAVQAKIEDVRDLVGKGPAGRGPFKALLKYEQGVFRDLVRDVRVMVPFNLLGGTELTGSATARVGILGQIWRALKGLQWLFEQHWVFFILIVAICLAVWSVFGGAISRIAALHVARDEKISIKEALKFSVTKFPSFLFAPLIPVLIIAVLGLLVLAGNFIVGNWGLGIGEVLLSVLFCLSLVGGFVMALVAVGTVGGMNLMYPTIAVEGSDSFDAISRSFSYVYARPWRMAFYSLVALIYGVLCYLFVRFFAFLMLKLTHIGVSKGVIVDGNSGLMDKFNTMWSGPSFESLHGGFDWSVCWGAQAFGAWIIAFWVYVVIGFVIAFLVSFFFSANTVIYYLLRNKVDATDMDDVYVEEEPAEEEVPPVSEESAKTEDAEKPESEEESKKEDSSEGE
ncbi:MAG: hypothetical protein GWP14_08075 [Actinobacteria bacterium]|nr:hypothetical protein [Actinomycetota bacterium]